MISKQNLQISLSLLALCLTPTLSGCATSSDVPTARSLPAAPAWAAPIGVQEPKAGEHVLVVAARERSGRLRANSTISSFRGWYDSVRENYAKPEGKP